MNTLTLAELEALRSLSADIKPLLAHLTLLPDLVDELVQLRREAAAHRRASNVMTYIHEMTKGASTDIRGACRVSLTFSVGENGASAVEALTAVVTDRPQVTLGELAAALLTPRP